MSAPQGAQRPRRRRLALAALLLVIAAGWMAEHRQTAPATPVPPSLPQPGGSVLTLYRFAVESGPAEVVTFVDTAGRWCRATLFEHEPQTASHYRCRTARLPVSGFGRVDSPAEMPTWDGMRLWVQGVVTPDVSRVTVTYRDGSVATAELLRPAVRRVVVFTVARPYVAAPVALRAYTASGVLVQELTVSGPSPLPWTPVP